jgi:hypothetical protein
VGSPSTQNSEIDKALKRCGVSNIPNADLLISNRSLRAELNALDTDQGEGIAEIKGRLSSTPHVRVLKFCIQGC